MPCAPRDVVSLPETISGISIDSRTVTPGEAYFAIKGDVHDGHDFVEAALKNGAGVAVIAETHRAKFADGLPLLVVPDVLAGLVDLARAPRARLGAKVIAVTGSVGKTSTKEALRTVFGAQGETHASVASFNNHWGVPLSLARCPASVKYAIFEIGMNHAGEIEPLVKMVRPHVAIITTVEPVHLEFFSGIEAIADAKAEIFAGVEPDGAAVLNLDNSQFARLKQSAEKAGISRIISFGSGRKSRCAAHRCGAASDMLCGSCRNSEAGRDVQDRRAGPAYGDEFARGPCCGVARAQADLGAFSDCVVRHEAGSRARGARDRSSLQTARRP